MSSLEIFFKKDGEWLEFAPFFSLLITSVARVGKGDLKAAAAASAWTCWPPSSPSCPCSRRQLRKHAAQAFSFIPTVSKCTHCFLRSFELLYCSATSERKYVTSITKQFRLISLTTVHMSIHYKVSPAPGTASGKYLKRPIQQYEWPLVKRWNDVSIHVDANGKRTLTCKPVGQFTSPQPISVRVSSDFIS